MTARAPATIEGHRQVDVLDRERARFDGALERGLRVGADRGDEHLLAVARLTSSRQNAGSS